MLQPSYEGKLGNKNAKTQTRPGVDGPTKPQSSVGFSWVLGTSWWERGARALSGGAEEGNPSSFIGQ